MKQSGVCLALLAVAATLSAQVNVLTANYGNERTNTNASETLLTPSLVSPTTFGKLGAFPVDGQIYAQPLVVSALSIGGAAPRDVVFLATMHNSVYAIDASAPAGAAIWHVNLGPPVLSANLNFDDIDPEIGILGTPVIDLARGVLYVVSDTLENKAPVFRLHALRLTDGQETFNGPTVISAKVRGSGPGNVNGIISLDPLQHLQRPGLLLLDEAVYVGFGSHADQPPYHGWLIGYNASDLTRQTAVFNTSPNDDLDSIWQAGRAPAADAAGNIYVVTANGNYDGVSTFGQSFLKFSRTLQLLDWFTPSNWKTLSDGDYDLGSTGAILVPGTNLVLGGNKYGTLFVVPTTGMGHLAGASSSHQVFQPVQWGGIFNLALWSSDSGARLYILEQGSVLKCFRLVNGRFEAAPVAQSTVQFEIPYQGIAVSANGGDLNSGVVWMTSGDHSQPSVPGSLHAFNAQTLEELWNSDMQPGRDPLGGFAKFVAPTVANGKVFVPTFSNQLAVYGLLPKSTLAPQISAVVNAASYDADAISPGEIVSIFGNQLGPAFLAAALIDEVSGFSNEIAGIQVLFNGVPAPLIFASAYQIGAIVPYSVAGSSAQVQVQAGNQISQTFSVELATASPAIFTQDSSGTGQVIAFNQDGRLNSISNAAAAGSIVVFDATGAGLTDPPSQDGQITSGVLPVPRLSVRVKIDGQECPVLYAGAAPGLVAGVMQVNVRVPLNLKPNPAASIVLIIGDQPSQTGASIAIQ